MATFIAEAMCMLYLAGFRLKTRWRTGGHSGTVYRQTMCMYTCTCTLTNNTEQETTLTLSLRDACRIRHLRWFWRQRTSQFRRLCSNTTTCKWGLSHQVFPSTGCTFFLLKHSVCEDWYRFALDVGVY